MKKIQIAVLCGGISSEHEVSLRSGDQVAKFLPRDKYHVSRIVITRDGRWMIGKKPIVIFNSKQGIHRNDLQEFDVVFIALHGKFGEDGKVQAILDTIGVPYTGSGALASALGMDKLWTNYLARKFVAIPKTIRLESLPGKRDAKKLHSKISRSIGVPYVVKPNASGSSVGTTIVRQSSELGPALVRAFKESQIALAQQYIKGRELTCGVLGNLPLPPVEIRTKRTFFDYKAKYAPGTEEICPAPLPPNITKKVKMTARNVHKELGCEGLTRSDFMLSKSGKLYFLEINTIPGLTSESLCPKEAKAAGMSFGEFLDQQVTIALQKNRGRYR